MVATGSFDKTAKVFYFKTFQIWSATNGKLLKTLFGHSLEIVTT